MNPSDNDLLICAKEPIHTPGFIQSHGFLLALNPETGRVEQISQNACEYLAVAAEALFSNRLSDIFEDENGVILQNLISTEPGPFIIETPDPTQLKIRDKLFDVRVHINKDAVVVEFEEKHVDSSETTLNGFMTSALANITSARSLQKLSDKIATIVKIITAFDRVMIYQFHPDGHGEVISECHNDGLSPFLHLHYPASDIPSQARDLYKRHPLRLIADAYSKPSPLLSSGVTPFKALDLSHCVLRAVSPIHIEYLQNMGARISFSVSLIHNNELWGLIACHNYEAKPLLSSSARNACRFIGELFSSSIERCLEDDMKDETRILDRAEQLLNEQMLHAFDIPGALTAGPHNLLSVNNASGAVLSFDHAFHKVGITPEQNELTKIVNYIKGQVDSDIYQNDHLPLQLDLSQENINIASGALFVSLYPGSEDYIVWFKPELIKTIDWAGNPDKPASISLYGEQKLSPRKSFEKWSREKKNHASPWSKAEIQTAVKLRNDTLAIQNRKLVEVKKRNELLQTAYDELDTFSYTISHDLKTPLAAIMNYSELILDEYSGDIPQPAVSLLQKVIVNSGKMNSLIKDVLEYSKVKRSGVLYESVDMENLLYHVCEQAKAAYPMVDCSIELTNILDVYGDETMILQLFQNLIGNALKYSGLNPHPTIAISAEHFDDDFILYKIKDNGIGFDMKDAHKIFDLFHRLDNVKSIEGTGVGLAISKRLVEKSGGKIWAESVVNSGTVFYVTLMKNLNLLA